MKYSLNLSLDEDISLKNPLWRGDKRLISDIYLTFSPQKINEVQTKIAMPVFLETAQALTKFNLLFLPDIIILRSITPLLYSPQKPCQEGFDSVNFLF